MRSLRVALAQINTTVGDLDGNLRLILEYLERATDLKADVVAFPELAITGYPPEDLLLRPDFITANQATLADLVQATSGLSQTVVVGFAALQTDIYNAAAVIHDGRVVDVYHKQHLPNYGVFDENRYFQRGLRCPVYSIGGVLVGVNICEDIWYPGEPTATQVHGGAEVIVNINASPFHAGKRSFRRAMLETRASDYAVAVCYLNQVGGQDELVFDGGSLIVDPEGRLLNEAPQFEEALLVQDIDLEGVFQRRLHDPRRRAERIEYLRREHEPPIAVSAQLVPAAEEVTVPLPGVTPHAVAPLSEEAEVYRSLVLGTRDYLRKIGFSQAVIGLSGGIDSALVAAIAAEALGPDKVTGVAMPSRYSSEGSLADARATADSLGINFRMLPIEGPFSAYLEALESTFEGTEPNVTEENLQARVRGNYLMALSNKFHWLVLTTGNKSEMAVGYATLYGDMAGGFAVIKDVPKTLVYRICRYINEEAGREVVPVSVIEKPPSAELRPDQLDIDSLPPYEVLDPILEAYVEDDRSPEEIVAMGYDAETVRRVLRLVNRSEYKRRQAPPGIKITARAFGRDRRLPIANMYGP
ncbi:MAG: NAD+ synthase [Dehalococcoidia bacterium]|nr:NAD+ synthase [Dehalococcoidia bacterium]